MYLVETGILRSFYVDLNGNDVTHWFAQENMLMTIPPGFFNEEVSQFGLESIEQTTVRAFSRKILDDAFEKHRIIETFCRVIVTQTMISLGQKVIDLKTKTAQERYEQLKENFPGISSRASLGKFRHIWVLLSKASAELDQNTRINILIKYEILISHNAKILFVSTTHNKNYISSNYQEAVGDSTKFSENFFLIF